MTEVATDKVCVVGLGRIGLPLAVRAAEAGCTVAGADISEAVVALVGAGTAPFSGEPGLDERLAAVVAAGRLRATTDTTAASAEADVVVVVVPLAVDDDDRPDFAILDAAVGAVGAGVGPGTLVSVETTLPVGTTRHRVGALLEERSGRRVGEDLFLVHSPERVSSGRVFADLRRYPKLVGGVDAESEARGVAFYERALDFDERDDLARPNGVWPMGSAEAAELTKLAETTYRDVNIAYANELALSAEDHGVDVYRVIDAANSQPFSHIHRPGVAVGGHCIPVYPHLLLATEPGARLPRTAREVNAAMPAHAVGLLARHLDGLDGRTVAILGLAFRGGVRFADRSGALDLHRLLAEQGATPLVHDPLWSADELRAEGFAPYELGTPVDAAVVQTDHEEYRALSGADLPGATVVVDGRAVTGSTGWSGVTRLVLGVGDRRG